MEQKHKKFVKLNNGKGKPVSNSNEPKGVIKKKSIAVKEPKLNAEEKKYSTKEKSLTPKKKQLPVKERDHSETERPRTVKQQLRMDKEEIESLPRTEKKVKNVKKSTNDDEVQMTNKERRVARVLQNAADEESGYKKPKSEKQLKPRNDKSQGKDKPYKKQEEEVKTKEQEEQDNDLILRLKKDLSFLITKNNSKHIKQNKVVALFTMIEGFIFKISQSKVGGRTLQLMLKFADESTRAKIFEKLLSNESLFGELIKSNYGHYVGITMIRTMPNQFKKSFFNLLLRGVFQFVVHQQASQVLDRFLIKNSSPAQINQIKQVFTQKSTGGSVDQELIENLAVKIIEKELHNTILALHTLNLALPIMVPVEREKIVSYFQALDNHDYLRLREGAQFFCHLINVSDSKVRKTIVKAVGNNVVDNLLEQGSFYYVGILKLLHNVDDTKITFKFILRLIAQNFDKILENKGGYSVISSLLIPKHNELIQFENKNTLQNLFSKKDDTARALELCLQIIDPLVLALEKYDSDKLLKSVGFSRFTAGVCRFLAQCIGYVRLSIEQVVGGVNFLETVIASLLDETTAKDQSGEWILGHPDSQRLAKSLILLATETNQDPFQGILTTYVNNLTNLLIKYLAQTLKSKAIYLLIPLLESTDQKTKIVKHLKKTKLREQDCMNQPSYQILQSHVQN